MTFLRFIHRAVAAALTLGLLLLNLRLYSRTNLSTPDVVPQLNFIGAALRDGAGERMQALFPEGFFFNHVLYGLAWAQVGMRRQAADALHDQALAEARWALAQLDTPAGRAPFSPALDPPLGVFYVGWSSWLRGGVLLLQEAPDRPAAEVARFAADCAALGAAFERSPTPFLTAYPGQAWPVDSTVAVAALRLCNTQKLLPRDRLQPARFTPTIERWLRAARARLDPSTGLLPHRADPLTGEPLEGARGSSQSIIARFLSEIDPVWGREQYILFRRQFVATPLGVAGVREYPHGSQGAGDVDSGPLLLGISLSASAVTLGAALVREDTALAYPLLQASEAFGLPISWGGSKRYLFGAVPVGDAFLVWSKSALPWYDVPIPSPGSPVVRWWWRLPTHALSLALVGLFWLPLRRRRRVLGEESARSKPSWPGT